MTCFVALFDISIILDEKYSDRVQLPAKAKFGVCRQHLATLASPTIRMML